MYFASNIKFLRNRKEITQDEMANTLEMKRSTLSGYENEVAEPALDSLLAISKFFNTSIETLISIDLQKLSNTQLEELENGFDIYANGSTLRVLATTVDHENNENVELVSEKAKAGYTSGYADPEYIRTLPSFQLPFLSRSKKYRAFQISGDSMHPIPDSAYVTGEFIIDWAYLKEGDPCIILTKNDGVVFKVLGGKIQKNKPLRLFSLNSFYKPYDIEVNEIQEIWKFVNFISSEMPELDPSVEMFKEVANLRRELNELRTKMN